MNRRFTPLLLAWIFLAPLLRAEPVELYLKWHHQFQFAGYYAALEQGYYAEEGLEVRLIERQPGQPAPIKSVLETTGRYGISDSSLVLDRLKGEPVVVVSAVYQHSPLVLATRATDDLLSPLELKGKKVMLQNNRDDAVLTAMFHEVGLEKSDFDLVEHRMDDRALITGEVDALSVYQSNQPYYYRQQGLKVHLIRPINYGVDFYGDLLFTSEDEAKSHPERLQAFRRASLRGWGYALEHSDELVELIRQRYNSQKSPAHLRYEAEVVRKMIQPDLLSVGYTNQARFQRIAQIYINQGLAPDRQLDGLLAEDYLGGAPDPRILALMALVLLGAGGAILLLGAVNRKLKKAVGARTKKLAEAKEKLDQYVQIVDKYVITSATDRHGIITYASQAFCDISGYSQDELLGRPHNVVRHPDMPESLYKDMWKTLKAGESWEGEIKNLKKNGESYWVQVHIDPVTVGEQVVGYTAIRQDITDRKRAEELSVTDRLTQLANRMKLDEIFDHEIDRSKRYGHPLSVILFDIDHFKSVNDTYGHQVGDLVLQEVAQLARSQVRAADTLGRWGGEEFMVICPETDLEGARQLAEKLRQAMGRYKFPKVEHKTSSFGVAAMRKEGESPEALVDRADQALYLAKQQGRNKVYTEMDG